MGRLLWRGQVLLLRLFRGFSAHPGLQKNFAAPNQHHPLSDLREGWVALGLPCSLVQPSAPQKQYAPGFAFFGLFRVRFAIFVLF